MIVVAVYDTFPFPFPSGPEELGVSWTSRLSPLTVTNTRPIASTDTAEGKAKAEAVAARFSPL